jgi:hypothetical protein
MIMVKYCDIKLLLARWGIRQVGGDIKKKKTSFFVLNDRLATQIGILGG